MTAIFDATLKCLFILGSVGSKFLVLVITVEIPAREELKSDLSRLMLSLCFSASDGCFWTEPSPAGKKTKPVMPAYKSLTFTSQWRPVSKDYVFDSTVRFNAPRTNPPYAYDQKLAFNRSESPSLSVSLLAAAII